MKHIMRHINGWIMAATLGVRCPGCQRPTEGGKAVCDACCEALRCTHDPGDGMYVDDGVAARIVRRAKDGDARSAVRPLVEHAALRSGERMVVTWVPADPVRRARRGIHLPQLLAHEIARCLDDAPCIELLQRSHGAPQRGRSREARRQSVAGVFRLHSNAELRLARALAPTDGGGPATLLVVDDVRTTGATLAACAAELCVLAGRMTAIGVSPPAVEGIAITGVRRRTEAGSPSTSNLRP